MTSHRKYLLLPGRENHEAVTSITVFVVPWPRGAGIWPVS